MNIRSFPAVVGVLSVASFVTLAMPMLLLLLAITIVGIPVALALMAAPTLLMFVLLARLLHTALGSDRTALIFAAIGALVAMAIPPFVINQRIERDVATLVAGDHDHVARPFAARTLAVRLPLDRSGMSCDDFCRRALLNRQVERFLASIGAEGPIDPNARATSYRLERGASCPAVRFAPGHDRIRIEDGPGAFREKRSDELIQIEIAKGNCFIETQARLGDADVILSSQRLRNGKYDYQAGFDINADTIRADRLTVHARDADGWRETYRWTGVRFDKLFPILAPTQIPHGTTASPGFLRTSELRNIGKYQSEPDWSAFLVKTLGMDLALRPEAAQGDVRGLIAQALDQPGPIDATRQKLIDDFFEGFWRASAIAAEDRPLILRVFADPRVRAPRNVSSAVQYAKSADPAYFDALARSAFARLRNMPAAATAGEDGYQEAASSAGVIATLPESAILPFRAELEWLARQEGLRVAAFGALKRLSVFGADAAPTLLYLIDDGDRVGRELMRKDRRGDGHFYRDNRAQHPYLAGLGGLCAMGPAGAAMIQPLLDRLESGVMVKHGSWWRLTVATLTSLGATTDQIWLHLQTNDRNHTRENLDREVARNRKRLDCSY